MYLVLTSDSPFSYRTFTQQYIYHFKICYFIIFLYRRSSYNTQYLCKWSNALKIKMFDTLQRNTFFTTHYDFPYLCLKQHWGFVLSKLHFSLVFLLNCSLHTATQPTMQDCKAIPLLFTLYEVIYTSSD